MEFYASYDQLNSTACSLRTLGSIQNYFFRVINFKLAYIRFGIEALFSILVRIYDEKFEEKSL